MLRVSHIIGGLLLCGLLPFVLTASEREVESSSKPTTQAVWRGFWVDAFHPGIKSPAEVDQLVADLQRLDCNVVFAQVRRRGDAYFRQSVEPFTADEEVADGFDPLEYLLKRAHASEIQVHAWVNMMPVWRGDDPPPTNDEHLFRRHGLEAQGKDNWLTCSRSGETRFPAGYFLDPGHPAVSAHIVNVVMDLVRKYPVDGIHLDYIRYPEVEDDQQEGRDVGYNPVSVARFNARYGRTGVPEPLDEAWQQWRRDQVTQLVRRLRVELLEENPQLLFSAALIAWRDGPRDVSEWAETAPYREVFQDWHSWRKEGLLDIAVPMNYDREHVPEQKEFFDRWIRFEKQNRYDSQLIVGLGAYLNSYESNRQQAARALAAADGLEGADGINFFSYAVAANTDAGDTESRLEQLRKAMAGIGSRSELLPPPKHPRTLQRTGIIAGFVKGLAENQSAAIAIRSEPGGPSKTVETDGNGFFAALGMPPGRYGLTLSHGGTAREAVDVSARKITWETME